jgi:branched-chain amino acid transport system ATP-binding protein
MSTDTDTETDLSGEQFGPCDGILVANDLPKRFGGLTAVDELSFAVQEQETLGFIGPNRAEKSMTFNCVTGTYP